MLFRGTLVRLWAWYFLLLVFILACFNVIVYFSLSQALNARVTADLQAKVRDTVSQLIANPNGTLTAYGPAADPSLADTFVFVIQTNKNGDPTVVENSPQLNGLEQLFRAEAVHRPAHPLARHACVGRGRSAWLVLAGEDALSEW